jgi:hypothetical protein
MKPVSPYRSSRLAAILFAAALIILWGNAAMAMTLNSPALRSHVLTSAELVGTYQKGDR